MGLPIIGITGELEAAGGNWIREAVVSPVSYTRAVERAGGTPVILPPVPASSVPVLIAGLNGLVLTGGRDVDPSLYDQAPHEQTDLPDHRRDRFELILTRAAIDADLPFLARSAVACTSSTWPAAGHFSSTSPIASATRPTGLTRSR